MVGLGDQGGGATRRLLAPALALALTLPAAWLWQRQLAGMPATALSLGHLIEAAPWLAGAWLVTRALQLLVWQGALHRPGFTGVPALIRGLVATLVWLAALIIVAETVFQLSVAAIVATSGIALAITGFALRDTLASFVAGVALSLEQPFRLGDWVVMGHGQAGQVVEIGWLTSRLQDDDGLTLVVPNQRLLTSLFHNAGPPGAMVRHKLVVPLDQALAPRRVERVLLAAAMSVPSVAAARRPPEVLIDGLGVDGVHWSILYWAAPQGRAEADRHALHRAVLHHLHHAGMALPYPRQDVFTATMPPRTVRLDAELDRLLARVDLLACLTPDELGRLAAAVRRQRLPAGVVVMREGDPGRSLVIVVEGGLLVEAKRPDGSGQAVGRLGPGEMVGEYALLTGAPRTATVTTAGDALLIEIDKDDLQPLLDARPDLAAELGHLLSQRQDQLHALTTIRPAAATVVAPPPDDLLERIRSFFGLGR